MTLRVTNITCRKKTNGTYVIRIVIRNSVIYFFVFLVLRVLMSVLLTLALLGSGPLL